MNEFLSRMQALLGDEYPAFLRYYEGENFRGLRLNTLKCTPDKLKNALPFELEPTPFCPQGYYIPADVQSLGNHPLHHCGAFYMQEPSATSAVEMLGVEEGDFVLDLCAAPGGKSTQIGAKLDPGRRALQRRRHVPQEQRRAGVERRACQKLRRAPEAHS